MSFDVRLTKLILENYKNMSEFIEETGLSRTLVDSYAKGRTIPSIKKVEEFAKLFNVSAAWLAYGVEGGSISNLKENEIIDLVNLIYTKVDEWLDSRNKEMDLDKKSILVKLIYKKLQLKELEKLSNKEVNQSIDDIIEILDAA